ncbi:SusC/RagA family TonB-linked outer membrane protein [Litoribacter alkaliphilus]|uniref:SusC/RagA family TonB-linked outer membrane protein n=1 Tax=Litoribacter ruber TaxID=702568 RepID=A0AAP2CNU3_9BACT|nr:SusC/RagA family TonB-linked outer membrane protein [Litoribacter alkaliphilus]MBS9525990.1 SusC/RagA family TonB-linked outer membrane protein [Litoribacter alkaliphilus]
MKRVLLIKILVCLSCLTTMGQTRSDRTFRGTVVDAVNGQGLPGAVIRIQNRDLGAVSDEEGSFILNLEAGSYTLTVDYVGFEQLVRRVDFPRENELVFALQESENALQMVEVVSTGYLELPKERMTGSFSYLDNELVDRRVGNNILDRLEDVTPGLVFNRTGSPQDPLSIRGRNTIFANSQPLIIIDNFPYDGPLENINPNDVESVTVLKDAAAASIWGARAGNGVIVITTKKGGLERPLRVSINTNFTTTQQDDLWYNPRMSTPEFLEVEELLFGRGFYNARESSIDNRALTPYVESMIRHRDGLISDSELGAIRSELGSRDVRHDLSRYYLRPRNLYQIAANIQGGTKSSTYAYSAGYDNNTTGFTHNNEDRITLSAQNTWTGMKGRLKVGTGLYLVRDLRTSGNEGPSQVTFESIDPAYPYARLVDDQGRPQSIIRDYRQGFVNGARDQGLLDWQYIPLEDLGRQREHMESTDIRVNLQTSYNILAGLDAEVQYQYWQNDRDAGTVWDADSYFTRNLINRYTETVGTELVRHIPLGAISNRNNRFSQSHNLRGQLRYRKIIGQVHDINLLGGWEVKDLETRGNSNRFYGYNPNLAMSLPVDYVSRFPMYNNPGQLNTIPHGLAHTDLTDRFVSYYFNGSYLYNEKYGLSASMRKDQSNLFGVEANMRGVPLWSVGGSWVLSNEDFLQNQKFNFLKLRSTFGYNGNVDKRLTAEVTSSSIVGGSGTINPGLPYSLIQNPANPMLRWEKTRVTNLGLDFEYGNGRFWGSIDFFDKYGEDLIGDTEMAPSSGVIRFRGNTSTSRSQGIDMVLNTLILDKGLKWTGTLIGNLVREKITGYFFEATVNNYLLHGSGAMGSINAYPLVGRPLYSVYSLPWAGLDPVTGDPRGYLDGEPSNNYFGVINNTEVGDMIYHGPARPPVFGAVRNDFSVGDFSLSVNISYRLGYFYRRNSVLYNEVLAGRISHADFSDRWHQPGDELITNVPSIPSAVNISRDNIYRFSEILVERGDHIRLQDVRFSYMLRKSKLPRLPFERAEVYTYANNLGILWKASDDPLDPDFPISRPLRSIAFGIRVDL